MMADERDDAVYRMRGQLTSLDVRTAPEHVERVLRELHGRRRDQRQQRMQMLAAVAVVVVAVAGAFAVAARTEGVPGKMDTAVGPTPVTEWPVRGELAGDKTLLRHAEDIWQASATPPEGPVHALFAGMSPNHTSSVIAVALAADVPDGPDQVAFVTTPVDTDGKPDKDKLLLRALTTVAPGQQGVGFLAAHPAGVDDPIPDNGSFGLALAAPRTADAAVRTSMVDREDAMSPSIEPGVLWPVFEYGVGAWNATLDVLAAAEVRPKSYPLAAGVDDPDVGPVELRGPENALRAVGPGIRVGDLIAIPDGLVGVVRDADGTVDTRLTSVGGVGEVQVAITRIPGSLVDDESGGTRFVPSALAPAEINPGNRLVVSAAEHPEVSLNVAVLDGTAGNWLARRAADPGSGQAALRIRVR